VYSEMLHYGKNTYFILLPVQMLTDNCHMQAVQGLWTNNIVPFCTIQYH